MGAELQIQSRYRIERRLHVGGMAEVFLARQEGSVERLVAIKRMLPQLAAQQEMCRRFSEEADLLARLAGPGLPALYEAGSDDEGPFLVLQYIEGVSLRELLAAEGPLEAALAAELLLQALLILGRLHGARDGAGQNLGFVHRDLAPENLQLGRDGRLWLLDLGLAKSHESQLRTAAGVRQGRLCYMAPELLRGGPASASSDRLALALIGAELVGALEAGGEDSPAALAQLAGGAVKDRLVWPDTVSPAYRELVESALVEEPAGRVGEDALREGLEALADRQAITQRGALAAGRPTPWLAGPSSTRAPAGRPWTGRLFAGALGAILLGLFFYRFYGPAWQGPIGPPPMAPESRPVPPAGGALVEIKPPPGGSFSMQLDGRSLGILRGRRSLHLPAGAHTLVLTDESTNRYYREDFLVGEEERRTLRFPLGSAGPPPENASDPGGAP